jgi:hypothetical protein
MAAILKFLKEMVKLSYHNLCAMEIAQLNGPKEKAIGRYFSVIQQRIARFRHANFSANPAVCFFAAAKAETAKDGKKDLPGGKSLTACLKPSK